VVRSGDRALAQGLTVGQQRVHAFPAMTGAELEVETWGAGARLSALEVFDTGGSTVPEPGCAASTEEPLPRP
jgi:alpha-L-fucosidase